MVQLRVGKGPAGITIQVGGKVIAAIQGNVV
jgi:hypothetical protein